MDSISEIPDISVLMTTYNVAPYLRLALESILNQTQNDFEFIIVDDGSNDGSDVILYEYAQKDERIHIVRQENRGLYPALNTGLELCQGKYIARMDADDIAMPNRLEAQARYLNEHDDISLVAGSIQAINAEGKEIGYWIWPTCSNDIRDLMLTTMCIFHPAVMFRKNAVLEIGGYPTGSDSGQDNVLWANMIINGNKFGNVPEVVLKWRAGRSGSITSTRRPMQRLEVLRCRQQLVDFARSPAGWLTPEQENKIRKAFPMGGSPLDNKPFPLDLIDLIDPIGSPAKPGNLESCIRAWLIGKEAAAEYLLVNELENNGHHFLARLVGKALTGNDRDSLITSHHAKRPADLAIPRNAGVSVILPWSDDLNDLQHRIECLDLSIKPADEIILLIPDVALNEAIKDIISHRDDITTIRSSNEFAQDLYLAQTLAKGDIIGYLSPNHRYDPDFIRTGSALITEKHSPLVFANRIDHFPGINSDGKPLDDIPVPLPLDRTSVLGQEGRIPLGYLRDERIYLSGFLHPKNGDWRTQIPLDKCVANYDWVIAMEWSYRVPFDVLPICNRRIRGNFHFEDRLWKAFLCATVQTYFETVYGLITDARPHYKSRDTGSLLNRLYLTGYPIHSRNRQIIFSTFLHDVTAPWRYPVFRYMCQWDLVARVSEAKTTGGWIAVTHVFIAWTLSLMNRSYKKIVK